MENQHDCKHIPALLHWPVKLDSKLFTLAPSVPVVVAESLMQFRWPNEETSLLSTVCFVPGVLYPACSASYPSPTHPPRPSSIIILSDKQKRYDANCLPDIQLCDTYTNSQNRHDCVTPTPTHRTDIRLCDTYNSHNLPT